MNLKKRVNITYAGTQSTYWMTCCMLSGFASVFLLANGYTNSQIGLILAAGSFLALFMQPLAAEISDRNPRITLIELIGTILCLLLVMVAVLFFVKPGSIGMTVFFLLILCGNTTLQPLVNALAFQLEKLQIDVNFGIARGIGSLSYAILSAVVGNVVNRFGAKSILVIGFVVMLLGLACIGSLRSLYQRGMKQLPAKNSNHVEVSGGVRTGNVFFLQPENRAYLFLLIGTFFLYYGIYFSTNFQIQLVTNVGGNVSDMGFLVFFTAMTELPAMFLFDRLYKKVSCRKLIGVAAVFFLVKITAEWMAPTVPLLFVAMAFQGCSYAIYTPASVRYVQETLGLREANKGQAYLGVMITAAGILASLTGGVLIDAIAVRGALLVCIAVTLAGVGIILWGMREK